MKIFYYICEIIYVFEKICIIFGIVRKYHRNLWHTFCIALGLWLVLDLYGIFIISLAAIFLREFDIQPNTLIDMNIYHCACILFCGIILICLNNKLFLCFEKIFRKYGQKWSFPVMVILVLCVLYFHKVYKRLVAERLVLSWLAFFFILAVFFIYRTIQKENTRDKILQVRFQMLEDNYNTLLNAQREKAALLHDMKHHISTLQSMMETGRQQDALNYIQQIYGELAQGQNRIWTCHPVIDIILNGKLQDTQRENIKFEVKCDDMSELTLKPMDICALFANLLDNAIEANLRLPQGEKRWIHLSCKRQKCMLIIILKNPAQMDINSKGGMPQTVKPDKENHGYGMYSIQRVVDSYDGHINFRTQDKKFILTIGLDGFAEDDLPMTAIK